MTYPPRYLYLTHTAKSAIVIIITIKYTAINAYKVAFGEEFNVTIDSVYWELVGHIFADEVAETNKGGMLDPLWKRVQRSTGTIDIGDDVIAPDKNRWLWDLIS